MCHLEKVGDTYWRCSLERMSAYIKIEQEQKPTKEGIPPAYWPASGDLRVERLSARYSLVREGLSLSFQISYAVIRMDQRSFTTYPSISNLANGSALVSAGVNFSRLWVLTFWLVGRTGSGKVIGLTRHRFRNADWAFHRVL